MASGAEHLLQQLRRLLPTASSTALPDALLLDRFLTGKDEDAFAALMARHGPMVKGICCRVLRDTHAAEDVTQATFLVLARKARTIRNPAALASWLHRTAYHLALVARTSEMRRRTREMRSFQAAPSLSPADPLEELTAREFLAVLDEELARLPERYRLPLLLCCLEGRTQEEAAQVLGWTIGSVKGRLMRGRAKLQRVLKRRGLSLSAVLLAVETTRETASAAGWSPFIRSTWQAAANLLTPTTSTNGPMTPAVAALVEQGLRSMAVAKGKAVLVILLALSVCAVGIGVLAHKGLRMEPPAAQQRGEPKQEARATPEKEPPKEELSARMDLYGDPLPAGARARLGTVRLRHRQHLTAVAYSPDGSLLASSGWDEVIHLWDANTGKSIRELTDPRRDNNLAIAFSPDGTKLASTGGNGSVRLWDVKSGRKLMDAKGHKDRAFGLAFAPDGRSFASAGYDGKVRLWDAKTGAELRTFSSGVRSLDNSQPLAFSPDGRTLVAGLGGTIWLWDVKTGEQRLAIRKAHGRAVLSLAFLGKDTLVSGGYHFVDAGKVDGQPSVRSVGELRFWDAATGKKMRDLTEDGAGQGGCSLAVSRNDALLAFSFRNEIRLWDLRAQKPLRRLTDYHNSSMPGAHDLIFSPDGKRLAAVMGDNAVHIWDTTSGRRLLEYSEAHRTVIDSVAYSPDGRQVATSGRDGVVRLWDVATAKEVGRLCFSDGSIPGAEVVAFSSDGRTLAAGGYELTDHKHPGLLKLWDLKSGAELWSQRAESRVSALTFSPDGQTVAVAIGEHPFEVRRRGASQTAIRIHERDTGKERAQLTGLTGRVRSLVFSPDGKLLRSCGDDWTLRVWELSSKKPRTQHLLNKERGLLQSVTFSPDGKLLATSVIFTDTVVLWDAITGTEMSKIRVEKSMGSVLVFSPDGRVLATGSIGLTNVDQRFDYDLHLWDLLTEREIRTLRPGSTVGALAFSPDGRELLAGMGNGTGLIWSVTAPQGNGRKPKGQMGEKELKRLWADLGGEDTARAYEAIGSLASAPKAALPFFRERLQPARPADPQRVHQLIADLDSSEFARREAAYHELEELGDKVRPALRMALEGKPPLEQRKRLEALLAAPRTIRQPELLRQIRAVQVLEVIGSEEARQVLRSLANGAAHARLTEEARASLQRLKTRSPVKP